MNLRTKKRTRRGITLVEVGIAATISSLLAAIGVGLICSLMAVSSATKAKADQQRTVARLADTFRADAHRADKAELKEAGPEVTEPGVTRVVFKQGSERSVCYTLTENEVLRQVNSGEKRIAIDSFLFGGETTFDVALQSVGEKTLAALTIHQKLPEKSQKRLPSILAAVGTSPGVVEILLPPEEKETEEKETEATEEKPEPKEGAEQ